MIERVVEAVNFTDKSERALLVAPVLAHRAGIPVVILHQV